MKKKPAIIILLALFHFIQPLINIAYIKMSTSYSISVIFDNLFHLDNFKSIFDFWLLFPIGGFALIMVKLWSWPLFLTVQFYSIYLHLTYQKWTWPYVSENPLLYSMVLLAFNILLIIYISLPGIRRMFFDKRIRWWETSRRYIINIPCKMTVIHSGEQFPCLLINISCTGVFLKSEISLPINTPLIVDFDYKKSNYSLYGKLVSIHIVDGKRGFGIKFLFDCYHAKEKRLIKKLINIIKDQRPKIPYV